jgi:hypothetical protein
MSQFLCPLRLRTPSKPLTHRSNPKNRTKRRRVHGGARWWPCRFALRQRLRGTFGEAQPSCSHPSRVRSTAGYRQHPEERIRSIAEGYRPQPESPCCVVASALSPRPEGLGVVAMVPSRAPSEPFGLQSTSRGDPKINPRPLHPRSGPCATPRQCLPSRSAPKNRSFRETNKSAARSLAERPLRLVIRR